ncbi:hypothetical protein G647_10360 [Cladophialophora carrionii CBS 160.54]|uniref:Peroxin 20 n=1 Tax=Cladophialophora carrionii CBS 160.54 TaxID=1279043 RepID=V9DIK7_9EURO|nr:uncharacterized protein G647_10360 [Cladophialophora carrionii CBS 160.54]ETI26700.1 hypothetical protein G647_10360 [Cladophialophora carrionii CBS 160.54]
MADALCGPSNPLQNLQKHTQVDRTLQQDRLVGNRQSPAQGFRTADPRAGALDADFHAFENSAPNPLQFHQPEIFHSQHHVPSAPGAWAADFQRLSLGNQSPVPAQQFRTEAPLIKSTPLGGWQNEFLRQRSSASTPVSQGKQAVRDLPQMSSNTFQPSFMNYAQTPYQSYTTGGFQQQEPQMQQPSMAQELQISDVDFEAAFADALAHAQEMDQDRAHQIEAQLQSDPTDAHQLSQGEKIKIGSDALHYVEKHERTAEPNARDADELARTAGELLNSVSHDTSEKFQNSQFLQLMRKIRDREVEVQNDDLQEKSTGRPASESLHVEHHSQGPVPAASTGMGTETDTTSHFEFPDMDAVYAPTNSDDMWTDHDGAYGSQAGVEYAASAVHPQPQQSPYTSYGFDDDQYPHTQMEALHPGGRYYPDQSPQLQKAAVAGTGSSEVEMSGAVPPVTGGGSVVEDGATLEKRISASDFEYVDQSAGLARRFARQEMSF